jgi:adenosylcobinamide-GDP ribazoletransferase
MRSELLTDLLTCLRFTTRLNVPQLSNETEPHGMGDFSRAAGMLPLAGALIGALAALVLWLAMSLGLAPLLASPLALVTLVLVTGALHEDGLADCADGFGGGHTREKKLEIMKDSRIGTFGAAALIVSLYLRGASLAILAGHDLALACTVLISTAALSRSMALLPLVMLPPARTHGAGFAAQHFASEALKRAAGLGALAALTPWLAGAGLSRPVLAMFAAWGAAYGVTRLAKRQIQGQTGDVAGAAQQLSEIAFMLVFAAGF